MSRRTLTFSAGTLHAQLTGDVAGLLGDGVAVLIVARGDHDIADELRALDHRLAFGELEREVLAGPRQLVDGERRAGRLAGGVGRFTITKIAAPLFA